MEISEFLQGMYSLITVGIDTYHGEDLFKLTNDCQTFSEKYLSCPSKALEIGMEPKLVHTIIVNVINNMANEMYKIFIGESDYIDKPD